MKKRNRFRPSVLLELFFDAALLLLFMAQAFLGGCFLIYGYLPLPQGWGNRLIARQLPPEIILEVSEFRLRLGGNLDLVGIRLKAEGIQQDLLQAEAAEIELQWRPGLTLPEFDNLVLSGGTLYLPSVYSPDGYHRPLLEEIAFRLIPGTPAWEVDRFAALHQDIRLRGAFPIPRRSESTDALDVAGVLNNFYTQAAQLSRQTERIRYFTTPTVAFQMSPLDDGTQRVDLRISSRALAHPEASADLVQLQGSARLDGQEITPIVPPRFSASRLEVPRYELAASGIRAAIAPDQFNSLLSGDWPLLKLAADQITLKNDHFDAPILELETKAFPEVGFHAATRSLDGVIQLDGRIDTDEWSGHMRAQGSVDLVSLVPPEVFAKLPSIEFTSAPHYDLRLQFKPGFSLEHAWVVAQVDGLVAEGLRFDHINARAGYAAGIFTIDDLYLRRREQWLDLRLSFDTTTDEYRVALIGSAIPYDYNALLPSWWAAIFKDFDFSQTTHSLGDFIIYGNARRQSSDLYFGRAVAHGVAYKNVLLDQGELIVRGRGLYSELHDLAATSGAGWARGDIAFTSKLDEVKGPVSIRLDMEAELTLDDAAHLFGNDIAAIIHDFETEGLPVTQLEGAIFNKAYPQYAGKSYFDLSADCTEPISYKGVPLDYLNFELFGRSDITYLRDIRFGYADGHGEARVDILTPDDSSNSLRYQLSLVDADQNQALESLPQLAEFDDLENGLQTPVAPGDAKSGREKGRIDLTINGQGAADDPFKHQGAGSFEIRNDRLGSIQLLGPLSRVLQTTQLNFTSFNLNRMNGDFTYLNELVNFDRLHIDGPRTHIEAPGTLRLSDQSLDMRVSASLFRNVGNPDSNFRKIGEFISRPLPNLLQFQLTGTIKEQKFRSLYDPRNFIPRF